MTSPRSRLGLGSGAPSARFPGNKSLPLKGRSWNRGSPTRQATRGRLRSDIQNEGDNTHRGSKRSARPNTRKEPRGHQTVGSCSGKESVEGAAQTETRAAAHWTSDDTNDKTQDCEGVAAAPGGQADPPPRPHPAFLATHRRQREPAEVRAPLESAVHTRKSGSGRRLSVRSGVEGTPIPGALGTRTSCQAVTMRDCLVKGPGPNP